MTEQTFTDEQATNEALLLLTRKLHRLFPETHADLMSRLPDGARDALNRAEMRADTQRDIDRKNEITRAYPPSYLEDLEDDDA